MVLNFDKPKTKDFTETVQLLANYNALMGTNYFGIVFSEWLASLVRCRLLGE